MIQYKQPTSEVAPPLEGQALFAAELVSCCKKHSLLFAKWQIKSVLNGTDMKEC